jgi:uroporphyrinogen-III synthase
MKHRLDGQRIVLFESRLAREISELVRRSGGVPVCVPAVVERRRPSAPEVAALLAELSREESPVFVLLTGVGTRALFDEARELGRVPELVEAVSRGQAVCRGPKAVAALYREGVVACLKARTPYTTAELLDALAGLEVRGRKVVLVHYGERNEALVEALTPRGALLCELLLYQWELPEDPAPLARAAEELVQGAFAAAAFTTQVQARNLMTIASRIGRRDEVIATLRSRMVVAAVGPTCARVLAELGVPAQVVPEAPKMAAMLDALVARLAAGSAA